MSDARMTAVASGCHIFSGCGYPAPSIDNFNFRPIFSIGPFHFTKPMLLALICVAVLVVFFWQAFARPKVVPRGVQNIAEIGLFFVRDQILRPTMGKKGDGYLPFLVSIFFFVWIMNIMGIIPVAQFPPMSRIGFPAALVLMVWLTYMTLGIKHQGLVGYFKYLAIPEGAPWWILPLLIPIELFSNILVRPFTLAVRLFANMLAGHLLILVFSLAAWYLASLGIGLLFAATSFVVVLLITGLEILIQVLQAFIFTILTATYIAGSLEGSH